MDLSKLSDEELLSLYQSVKGGVGPHSMGRGNTMFDAVKEGAPAALIAHGRFGDRAIAGMQQLNNAAEVIKSEALGKDSSGYTANLGKLEADQAEKDRLYAPLQRDHPVATAFGEKGALAFTPMGQATTVGRIMAPAVAGAALEAIQYGDPKQRATRAAIGGGEGVVGGAVGEGLARGILPSRGTLSKPQQDVIMGLEQRLGVKARPSQLSGSQTLGNVEDMLANSPGGAGVWADFAAKNRAAVNKAAASSIGSNADAPTREVLNAQKATLGAEYDALRGATKMPVVGEVFNAINKSEQMLSRGAGIKGKDEALGVLSQLKEQLWNTKQLSGADYQAWTSDLATAARETNNSTVKAALRQVERAMDKVARVGNEKRWQEADVAWANLKTLMRPNAANEITGDVSPRGVYLAQQVSQKDANKLGTIGGPLRDIADYGKALPPLREGSQTARRGMFGDMAAWAMSPINYGASKTLTSEFGRQYMSQGLLGNPEISKRLGRTLGQGAVPVSMAELELLFSARQ